jgi:hypothetical protein
MSAEKLLSFIEDFTSAEIKSQDFEECYELINLRLSQIDLESKLKYPNDCNQQMTYKYVRLEYCFKDFFTGIMMHKSRINNTNQFICKLLNK